MILDLVVLAVNFFLFFPGVSVLSSFRVCWNFRVCTVFTSPQDGPGCARTSFRVSSPLNEETRQVSSGVGLISDPRLGFMSPDSRAPLPYDRSCPSRTLDFRIPFCWNYVRCGRKLVRALPSTEQSRTAPRSLILLFPAYLMIVVSSLTPERIL